MTTREFTAAAWCPCCREMLSLRGTVEHGELVARVPRHRDNLRQPCPLSRRERSIPVDDLITWRRAK